MKKLFLMMAAGLVAFNVDAQYNVRAVDVQQKAQASKEVSLGSVVKLNKRSSNPAQAANAAIAHTANKPTLGGSRWYSHVAISGEYNGGVDPFDPLLTSGIRLWQDSTVTNPAPNQAIHIQFLSAGQIMQPQAPIFNNTAINSNIGLIAVNNEPYTLDSVKICGFYDRKFNTYDDTLIVRVMTETAAQKHAYISYAGSVLADHGIDSANAQLWSVTEQAAENIFAQVAYTTQTPASYMTITEYKVVLDQALFLDSTADGFHFISVATNSAIPANRKSSVSVTFKSGTTYNAGDPIDMYNNFFIVAHETIDNGFVTYSTGDENMSSLVDKDTQLINATLGIYSPTIAYTPGLAELVDISFKVTCPTCNLVGASTSVNNVNAAEVADAYPNPANNMLTIPFTMNQTSNVSVVVTNAVGATLASQNLGKINAKQTGSAKINVASFANGVYFYTVDANGQRTTKRFVVAH